MTESVQADVVIVGSGVAGALMAATLAASGVKVLILEAGPRIDRGDGLERFQKSRLKTTLSAYPIVPHAPSPDTDRLGDYYVQSGPTVFEGLYLRAVGGSTWHWGGNASRLHPNDFRMRSQYGVALDWPIEYAAMLHHYEAAERELGVAGDPSTCLVPAPRGPFPMPPIPQTYNDKVVAKAAAPLGMTLKPTPQARNSVLYDDRPPCCGSATCVPMCPIGAKYDGSVHVGKAEASGAVLVENAVAHRIDLGADRQVTAVRFLRPDGSEGVATGRIFVIAAHAIETPKLLLMSRGDAAPEGMANGSGLVGRNLMAHIQAGYVGLSAEPVYSYRGPVETSGFAEWRDGAFRSEHAAMGSGSSNQGWARAIGPQFRAGELIMKAGLVGTALRRAMAEQTIREVAIGGSAEILPNADNRVTLDEKRDAIGLPRPHIHFSIDDYTKRSLDLGQKRHRAIMEALRCTSILDGGPRVNTSIIGGTARMGVDPKTSVVDAELRSHEHRNLFVVGSAVFPTMGISPPTLTIAALALRAAAQVKVDLARG
jgi:choline dehydrogenase-like flavoprotein